MNTEHHSTSCESQSVSAGHELRLQATATAKMPCRSIQAVVKNEKRTMKQARGRSPKLAFHIRNMSVGADHTMSATDPVLPIYATFHSRRLIAINVNH
jgi:hypothetical protein